MTTTTDNAASDGALSVDQAVSMLMEQEAAPEAPEAAEPAVEEHEGVGEAEEPAEAEEDEEAEAEDEGELEAEEETDPAPVVDPPHFWPADAKDKFANLPADLQELVAEQERARVTHFNTAQEQLALARKAATTEAQKLIDQMPAIETALAEVDAAYKSENWETVDWAAWADQDPAAAFKGKILYDAQTRQKQQLETAKQAADDEAFRAYTVEQAGELQRLAPAIAADDATRSDIVRYLINDNGYDPDLIRGIRAKDVVIAHKAMLWDRSQSKAKAQAAPGAERPAQAAPLRKATPSAPPARPVRPGPAATAPSPKRASAEAEAAFSKKSSPENAVRLLLARGTG